MDLRQLSALFFLAGIVCVVGGTYLIAGGAYALLVFGVSLGVLAFLTAAGANSGA